MPKNIAIVGNVVAYADDAAQDRVREIAAEFGRELALAGFRIVVYTSHPRCAERYVVAGYASSPHAKAGSIRVLHSAKTAEIDFPEAHDNGHLFDWDADASPDWEVSFYQSLYSVDGILVLGGGRSTLIAGLIAIAQGTPIVTLRATGGSADIIWAELETKHPLITHEQRALLGRPHWDPANIKRAVRLFDEQVASRERQAAAREAQSRAAGSRTMQSAFTAICLLVWSLCIIALAVTKVVPSALLLGFLLILGPLIAGGAGATIRSLLDLAGGQAIPPPRHIFRLAALGIAAGAISALLAILPQLLAEPHLPEKVILTPAQKEEMRRDEFSKLIPLAMVTGFIGGFATDRFYKKLQDARFELPNA